MSPPKWGDSPLKIEGTFLMSPPKWGDSPLKMSPHVKIICGYNASPQICIDTQLMKFELKNQTN